MVDFDELAPIIALAGLGIGLAGRGSGEETNKDPLGALSVTTDGYTIEANSSGSSDPDGQIVQYDWRLFAEDGTLVADDINGDDRWSYTVSQGGVYEVEVTLTDDDGATRVKSLTKDVQSQNEPPLLAFSKNVDGMTIEGFADGSSDPDGQVVAWDWELQDSNGNTIDTATGDRYSHTVSTAGEYALTVTITDDDGATSTDTLPATVEPVGDPPTVSINVSNTDSENTHFDISGSDPDTPIEELTADMRVYVNGTETYDLQDDLQWIDSGFTVTWNTHDGEVGDTLEAEITVTDPEGHTATDSDTITLGFSDGGGGDGNTAPQGALTVVSDGLEIIANASGSSDPDGQIVQYDWELLDTSGNVVKSADNNGDSWNVVAPAEGDYEVVVVMWDDDGATTEKSLSTSVTNTDFGSGLTNMASATVMDRAVSGGTTVRVESTGELQVEDGIKGQDYGDLDDGGWWGEFQIEAGGGTQRFAYDGGIRELDWDTVPIKLTHNGERVDPYMTDPRGGPRKLFDEEDALIDDDSKMIEVSVYQTAAQYDAAGFAPAESVATWLSQTLRAHGLASDVTYVHPPVEIPTNDTACWSPYQGSKCRTDGCDSFDCCSIEDSVPAALYLWNDLHYGDGQLIDKYENDIGADLNIAADVFHRRKDSNILLTDREGGGCGYVGGNLCAVGAAALTEVRPYDPSPSRTPYVFDIQTALHEFAHNLGYTHDGSCDNAGGQAYNENGYYYGTPALPQYSALPCDNKCGNEIPPNTSSQLMVLPYWVECDIEIFRENTGSREGNVAQSYTRSRGVCGRCEDTPGFPIRRTEQERQPASTPLKTDCDCC